MIQPVAYSISTISDILEHEGGEHSVLILVIQLAKRPAEPLTDIGLGDFRRQASLATRELSEGG